MQLLSPSQTRNQKEDENTRTILRTQELRELERDSRISSAKAEADFQSLLVSQRKRMEQEEAAHASRIAEMQAEVDKLEAAKINAMVPFEILKESAEERMAYATQYAKELREREDNVEETTELLERKLSEVAERQSKLDQYGMELARKQDGIDRQADLMKGSNITLTKAMTDFAAEKLAGEADITSRTEAVTRRETSVRDAEESNIKESIRLEDMAKRLADERGVLDRAFAEVRRMKGNKV